MFSCIIRKNRLKLVLNEICFAECIYVIDIWWNWIWEECDCVEIENNSIVQKLQVGFITFLKSHNAWWEMHISLCGCALQKKKSLQCMCTQKSSHMSIYYLYCSFHYKIITKDLKFLDLSSLLCCQNIILKS